MTLSDALGLIRDIPDFPKPGILFKDITPLLASGEAFKSVAASMAMQIPKSVTHLVAIESRGFILASAMAQHLKGVGVALVRKPGKLPGETHTETYALEYGTDSLQIQKDLIPSGSSVAIIDDVLATGGTANAVEKLCQHVGLNIELHMFLMEIDFLQGRKKLSAPITSIHKV